MHFGKYKAGKFAGMTPVSWAITFVSACYIGALGFSRVYLGQNDIGQVVFGMTTGISLAIGSNAFYRFFILANTKEIDRSYTNKYYMDSSDEGPPEPKTWIPKQYRERRFRDALIMMSTFMGVVFGTLVLSAVLVYHTNLLTFEEPAGWATNMCSGISENEKYSKDALAHAMRCLIAPSGYFSMLLLARSGNLKSFGYKGTPTQMLTKGSLCYFTLAMIDMLVVYTLPTNLSYGPWLILFHAFPAVLKGVSSFYFVPVVFSTLTFQKQASKMKSIAKQLKEFKEPAYGDFELKKTFDGSVTLLTF